MELPKGHEENNCSSDEEDGESDEEDAINDSSRQHPVALYLFIHFLLLAFLGNTSKSRLYHIADPRQQKVSVVEVVVRSKFLRLFDAILTFQQAIWAFKSLVLCEVDARWHFRL